MEKPTVLIIDDHQLIRDMWTHVLEDSGQVAVLKYSGRFSQTLEMIQEKKPTVILLDVCMTPLSGFELMPIIKQHSPGSHVIGFSNHANPAYAREMIQLGASGYVTKSADVEEVLAALQEVQAGKQYLNREMQRVIARVGGH